MVGLTEKGAELKEKAADIPCQVGGCIALGPEETAELYRLLYKLLDKQE